MIWSRTRAASRCQRRALSNGRRFAADRAPHHVPEALSSESHAADRAAPQPRLDSPGQFVPPRAQPLEFDNGLGGIDGHGDYRIRVRGDSLPPAPWANVIANPFGGFIVTERGAGFTWAENSYFYRLTPWHNDPVCDPMGEVFYLGDEETGECWSPTPAPIRDGGAYTIRHGAGSSTFEHSHGNLASELTLGMADDAAVKIARLKLTNHGRRARRLTITAYVEWTLGVLRDHTHHVRTEFQAELGALCAYDTFDPHFAGWTSFCALSEPVTAHTADRREFIGRNGTLADPAGLRAPLSGAIGSGLDPCAALQCELTLAPGETREVVMLLGAAASQAEAERLITRHRDPIGALDALARSVAVWHDRLSVITVQTPEPAFDVDDQPLGTLPGTLLTHVGTVRVLPEQWRLRLSRSAAGCHGLRVCRAGMARDTHPARGRSPVPGRRRATLVAPAYRPGRAHPLLGRPGLAALRDRALHARYRRCGHSRRERPVSQHARAGAE